MSETSERVTVRIPQDLLEKLKRIQEAKGVATISDTIREGLERYIEMNLSRQDNRQLEEFVKEGASISVDDAVRSAVREYIRTRLEQASPGRGRHAPASVAAESTPPP
jgi:metal-responsive CopG/Arc/MetJ family transcriptional regulator